MLRDTGKLDVLLIKRGGTPYKGCWAFPGGFVDAMEDLEVAAKRELEEETCLKGVPMLEIGMFGMPGRDPRGHTITAAYLAAAGEELAKTVKAADDAAEADWVRLAGDSELPQLAFDHANIMCSALRKASRGIRMGDSDIIDVLAGGGIPAADLAPEGRVQRELEQGWLKAARMWVEQAKERADSKSGHLERASKQLAEAERHCGSVAPSTAASAAAADGGDRGAGGPAGSSS